MWRASAKCWRAPCHHRRLVIIRIIPTIYSIQQSAWPIVFDETTVSRGTVHGRDSTCIAPNICVARRKFRRRAHGPGPGPSCPHATTRSLPLRFHQFKGACGGSCSNCGWSPYAASWHQVAARFAVTRFEPSSANRPSIVRMWTAFEVGLRIAGGPIRRGATNRRIAPVRLRCRSMNTASKTASLITSF